MPARATRSPSPALPIRLQAADLKQLRATFDQQHRTMFGHMAPEEPVEIVSYRVRGIGLVPPVAMPRFKPAGTTLGGCLHAKCGACVSTAARWTARSISASGSMSG